MQKPLVAAMRRVCLPASVAWSLVFGLPAVLPLSLSVALPMMLVPNSAMAAARDLPDFSDLVEKAGPAVVNIRTTQKVPVGGAAPNIPGLDPNDPFYEFFRRFFPPNQMPNPAPRNRSPQPEREVPSGVGSGFVIDNDGFILTNHHVVDGAETITVTFPDKREFKGRVVGSDQRTDVALVKIEGRGFPVLKIGDVNKVKVGQWALAIGSPFGLENSVSAGIVSAKARETGEYLPFIQTDVAVNPGNSGGPLLNLDGEVIGINSQIYSRTGGFMGISFAIPIDEATRVAKQLRESGKVSRGRIGVSIGDVDKEVAKALGLNSTAGALVGGVSKDGPADKAGIVAGDIILRFDGRRIEKSTDLPRMVGETKPGSRVNMTIWRKGSEQTVRVLVAEFEPEPTKTASVERSRSAQADRLGLTVAEVAGDERKGGGVQVRAVTGPAAAAGLAAGDVIVQIGRTDIASVKQYNELIAGLNKGQTVPVLVRRGEGSFFVVIAL